LTLLLWFVRCSNLQLRHDDVEGSMPSKRYSTAVLASETAGKL
jgi:hypothetical protein